MSDPRRIVVRAPNWLGDAVMALPAMGAIRRAFSGKTVIVAARSSIAPLFGEMTPAAPDEIVIVDDHREAAQLRGLRADAIVLLPNSFGSAWTAKRAAIGERWGYRAGGRGLLLTRSVARPRGRVHQVEYYAALARGLGFESPEGERPAMSASPGSLERADRLLRQSGLQAEAGSHTGAPIPVASGSSRKNDERRTIVVFAPGAAYGHAKRWPPDRVAQVIARLSTEGVTSVLVGARDDRESGRAIESTLPVDARVVNLIGRTSLGELVGVIARAAAFVSNDSGAMHIAAALGVPLTAIFGPTDERVTAPAGAADVILRDVFCRPCMLRECPIDHRCMKRIDVDSVFASVTSHCRKAPAHERAPRRVPRP
jgi:heptosyltransferase-2